MLASLVLPLTLALSSPASAKKDKRVVIDRVDVDAVSAILQREGYQVERKVDGQGDPLLAVQGKINFAVIFYGCVESACQTVQPRAYWTGDHGVTTQQASERMRVNRFGRSYIDSDGDITFEAVLESKGGITMDRVDDFMERFLKNMTVFERDVVQKK